MEADPRLRDAFPGGIPAGHRGQPDDMLVLLASDAAGCRGRSWRGMGEAVISAADLLSPSHLRTLPCSNLNASIGAARHWSLTTSVGVR